ncbi:MAG TPA: pyridoxamine 5'-phosphate oxidase family protein [Cyclobacteriaceae bacterium]|nr:pyridoxamine 5'-phosphate oxidase family protein [Cyclobacteriaceae bacterium]
MKLLSAEAFDFVRKMKLGYLVSILPEEHGHLSRKGTLAVFDNGHLIIADMAESNPLEFHSNANVTVEVTDPFSRKGYRFHGKASLIPAKPEAAAYIAFYESWGLKETACRVKNFILIEVGHFEAFIAPSFSWVTSGTVYYSREGNFNNLWKF